MDDLPQETMNKEHLPTRSWHALPKHGFLVHPLHWKPLLHELLEYPAATAFDHRNLDDTGRGGWVDYCLAQSRIEPILKATADLFWLAEPQQFFHLPLLPGQKSAGLSPEPFGRFPNLTEVPILPADPKSIYWLDIPPAHKQPLPRQLEAINSNS